jgi:hypothetical protein
MDFARFRGSLSSMKWACLIITLMAVGCGTTQSVAVQEAPEGMELLADEDLVVYTEGDRTFGYLSDLWADHLRDSATGMDFLMRSMSRNVLRDYERMQRTFD